jgi:hypothetical protein
MRLSCICLAIGILTAGQPQPTAPSLTGTIDFRATTAKGETVTDLTAADVSVKVGGRERRIRSLDVITPARAFEPASAPAGPLPPPFAVTPAADTGAVRHVMLIVDEGLIPFGSEQPLKDGVARLLEALSPRDRVGLVSLKPGGAQIDYTTDRAGIQSAVNAMVGGRSVNDPSYMRLVLNAIRANVGSIPRGLSSSVLFISGGVSASASASMRDISMPMAGGSRVQPDELRAVEQAIELSQVNAHVVHVGAAISQGLNNLAGSIGAGTALLSFADATTLARVVAPSSSHYRVTFDGDASDRPGAPQRVELRVARQNVRADAPSLVTIDGGRTVTLSAMMRSPSASRDVPLRAASFPSSHQGNRIKIVVLFEPIDPEVKLTGAMVAAFDENDQVVTQTTLRPVDLATRPIVAALPLAPGKYRVRVAATDAAARGGTVDETISAALQPAGPLQMSGLILGTRQDGKFAPRLEFAREPAASAYIELYSAAQAAGVSVVFELADSENGPAKARAPAVIEKGPGDILIATGELPIGGLAAGDAVVRAVVSVDGTPAGTRVRTLRKAAR